MSRWMRSTAPANFPISLEEYDTLPERTRDVEVEVVVVVELPQLVVKINTTIHEALRRILYSFGLTRMRPS